LFYIVELNYKIYLYIYILFECVPFSGIFYTIQNDFAKNRINNSIEYMINDEYIDYTMSNLFKKHERLEKFEMII